MKDRQLEKQNTSQKGKSLTESI